MVQINAAAQVIYENVADDANIIFGAVVDEKMRDQVSITVLATGFTFSDNSDSKKGLKRGSRTEDLDAIMEALEKVGYWWCACCWGFGGAQGLRWGGEGVRAVVVAFTTAHLCLS